MPELTPYEVGQQFLELHNRLRRLVDETMSATGVSLSRAKVLNVLDSNGPLNQSAIAGKLGFAARSVTDAVDTLVRDQLAERTADPDDGRARIVAITPSGTKALKRAMQAKHQMFDQIFGSLNPAQRQEFALLLKAIERPIADIPGGCCDQ